MNGPSGSIFVIATNQEPGRMLEGNPQRIVNSYIRPIAEV